MKTRFFQSIFFLFFAGFSLSARDIELIVKDTELDMPLEGAVVRVENTEYTADADGRAVFSIPDTGRIIAQIAYPGYENQRFVIPAGAETSFTIAMRLSAGNGLENKELVIEAAKPGTSEVKTGRSVGISDKDLSRTAEIGIIEDVMTSIKLLPGVGYTGMFNARPSIRGGEPGDLMAVFDGFYIESPYHWGGGVSIFDPRMVQSARLSHGVFSARYGHTISGLLEIASRKPDSTDVELELGLSSSAANLNLSYPLFGRGGVMVMGKVTYWDPFVEVAKLFIDEVNYVKTAPYIRSAAIEADYRFTQSLSANLSGFIGADGAGAYYKNESETDGIPSHTDFDFDWLNMQGFLIAGVTFNPRPDMLLKGTVGAGFFKTNLHGYIDYDLTVPYSNDFLNVFGSDPLINGKTKYTIDQTMFADMTDLTANYQARTDYDWEWGKGFLFAAGLQELYAVRTLEENDQAVFETESELPPIAGKDIYVNFPAKYKNSSGNQTLASSAYTLLEYSSPQKKFGGELGLRLDHLYFIGRDFTLQTIPALNPRLNLDWNILRDKGIFDSVNATVGTGLFSSITDNISSIQSSDGFSDFELKQNRSWTSIAGVKLELRNGVSFNLEGYYKYVFDRAYTAMESDSSAQKITIDRRFDGEGRIWGFDLMLQKIESRYWDGWLSYSFTYARYRDPASDDYRADWYYPRFHRFHNVNLVLNIKPSRSFNIATRLGFASGAPKTVPAGDIEWYPVVVMDESGDSPGLIQKYKRESAYSDTERDGFALTLDLKFSFFKYNPYGRGRREFYIAVENVLAMLETRRRNSTFNQYTGKEDQGSNTASYQLPIPMPSIGFKWSY
jgi:hypothetical protein